MERTEEDMKTDTVGSVLSGVEDEAAGNRTEPEENSGELGDSGQSFKRLIAASNHLSLPLPLILIIYKWLNWQVIPVGERHFFNYKVNL